MSLYALSTTTITTPAPGSGSGLGPVRIAIVGCGAMVEQQHLPSLLRLAQTGECRLVALVERDRDRTERLAERCNQEPGQAPAILTDYHELLSLAGQELDAVLVGLPNHLHAPIGIELLEAGLHVLTEKPIANSVDECDTMIAAATRPGIEGEVLLVSGAEPVSWKDFYQAHEDILGINSTADISAKDLEKMWKRQQRDASTLTQIRKALWNRDTVGQVLRTPAVRGSLKFLKRVIPDKQRQTLKSRVLPSNKFKPAIQAGRLVSSATGNKPEDPIHVPDETLLSLYRPRTRVCIDKARKLLGYEPQFDFERGMSLTAQYVRWANLADRERPADRPRRADKPHPVGRGHRAIGDHPNCERPEE